MTLDDLEQYFENGNKFEVMTGMSHASWHNWFRKYGYVPIRSQKKIQRLTKGALKADLNHIPEVK